MGLLASASLHSARGPESAYKPKAQRSSNEIDHRSVVRKLGACSCGLFGNV